MQLLNTFSEVVVVPPTCLVQSCKICRGTAPWFGSAAGSDHLSAGGRRSRVSDWYFSQCKLSPTIGSWSPCIHLLYDFLVISMGVSYTENTFVPALGSQYYFCGSARFQVEWNSQRSPTLWTGQPPLILAILILIWLSVSSKTATAVSVACSVLSMHDVLPCFGSMTWSWWHTAISLKPSQALNHHMIQPRQSIEF